MLSERSNAPSAAPLRDTNTASILFSLFFVGFFSPFLLGAKLPSMKQQRIQAPPKLTDRQKTFVDLYSVSGNHRTAAEGAGFNAKRGSVLLKSPRIQAALAEHHDGAQVWEAVDQQKVISGLLAEARKVENTGAARVQAWSRLADILGLTGGGGNRELGTLEKFLSGIGTAIGQGVFAATTGAKPLSGDARPVVVDSTVVREDFDVRVSDSDVRMSVDKAPPGDHRLPPAW